MTPTSARLNWTRLSADNLDAFHRLITNPHVRRYLCDGQVLDRAWCAATAEASTALFAERGIGLWLLSEADDAAPIGFAGFHPFEEMGPTPQLLYAFVEAATGRGLATEAATALLPAGTAAGIEPITAAVDGPNTASLKVLAKAGFERVRTTDEGAFGSTVYFARRARVSLEELTADNFRAVLKLTVGADQQGFVAPNPWSIAEAHFHPEAWYRGIYANGVPVGFVMLAVGDAPGLWRLMIDARYQGRGYGRDAMKMIIAHVRDTLGAASLTTSYVPGPGNPSPFYESLGFVETGEVDEGERVLKLTFERR